MGALPFFKFYPANWRGDAALRMCSIAARGFWMEMLCLMHEASPRGDLLVNGKPVTDKQLASLAGVSPKEAADHLAELEEAGVFSRRDNGTIYSRRMDRDEKRSAEGREHGSKGGNPKLIDRDKGWVKGPDNPQGPKAITAAPTHMASSVASSVLVGGKEEVLGVPREANQHDVLESKLLEAAGLRAGNEPGLIDLAPIYRLLDAGYDLEREILPALREAHARGKHGSTWGYYSTIIQSKRKQAAPVVAAAPVVDPVVFIPIADWRWPGCAAGYEKSCGLKAKASESDGGVAGRRFPKRIVDEVEATALDIPASLKRTPEAA